MPDTPLRCRKCGGNKFIVPNHATNESLVTCAGCGDVIGRWGDFRIGILEEAKGQKIQKLARAQKTT